jgi:dCTP deaminase
MAILTKDTILQKIKAGEIKIRPSLDSFQLRSHAIDLRLGYTFLTQKQFRLTKKGREAISVVDSCKDGYSSDFFDVLELEEGQYFELLPGEHVCVSSLESITFPLDLMAVLYPRSSVSRRGLSVDLTGIIDAGYEGQLLIPIRNNTHNQIVRLYPGERFCQIVFETLDGKADFIQSRFHKKDLAEGVETHKTEESLLVESGKIKELKKQYALE